MAKPNNELAARLARRLAATGDTEEAARLQKREATYEGAPPPAPAYPTLANARDTSLKIKWDAVEVPTPGEEETKRGDVVPTSVVYRLEYGYRWTGGWTAVDSGPILHPKYILSGLEPNTNYVTRVSARWAEGKDDAWGAWSASSYAMATLTTEAYAAVQEEAAQKRRESIAASAESLAARKAVTDENRRQNAEDRAAQAEHDAAAAKALLEEARAERERARREAAEERRKLDEARKAWDKEMRRREEENAKLHAELTQLDAARREQQAAAEAAAKAAAERQEEANRWRAEADAAASKLQEESLALSEKLARMVSEKQETEAQLQARLEAEAGKSEEERARLASERKAVEEAAAAEIKALQTQLQGIQREREAAAAEAEARAKREAEEVKQAAARKTLEAQRVVEASRLQLKALQDQLASVEKDRKEALTAAQKALKAEAARKEEAEELVRWQAEQAEREAQRKDRELAQLRARVAASQEQLTRASDIAEQSARSAEAISDTIFKQAEENERLRRLARVKDATIRSLQGAGPNPELEAALVAEGHRRDNIRFFMEVHGWENKKRLVSLLMKLRKLVADGHKDEPVREALMVCRSDAEVLPYLRDFAAKHPTLDDDGDDLGV